MPTEPCAETPAVDSYDRVALFRLVLLQRLFEDRVMALYRQGRVPGSVYTGRGQEAVAAGAGLALGPDDVVAPLNRELACHFARGATPADAFRNFLGKATGPTGGRDGNMHFGAPDRGVFPLVSMLGDLVPVVTGAALAFKRRGQARVAMTFLGEGAFSVGDTHEGLNLASVWQVPAVFVIQANRYSYSTPVARQMLNTNIAQRIYGGWSIPAERVDGTDALAVLDAVRAAVERARNGNGPQAVEALSVRMHGHAGHDDARYMPAGMREAFAERYDPVDRLAVRLALDGFGPGHDRRHARVGRRRGGRGAGRGRGGARSRPVRRRERCLRCAALRLTRESLLGRKQAAEHQLGQNRARAHRIPVVSAPEVTVRAVDRVDEHGRHLGHVDLPDRPVGNAVGEQALDRVDVAVPGPHLVAGFVKEPPVRLLVERGEEREVILGHLADGDEHRREPLDAGAAPRHGRPQRSPEGLLVVARQQREDLVATEAAAVQRHSREAGLLGDPGQRGRLPAARRDRATRTLDDPLLGAVDLCHRRVGQ